jgi:DNA invertase Pin-like site-specific DNA recombinase
MNGGIMNELDKQFKKIKDKGTLSLLSFNSILMDTKRNELNKLSQERTTLIRKALDSGWSVAQVGEVSGLSRQRVYMIINKGENK